MKPNSCLCPDRVQYQCHVNGAQSLVWNIRDDSFNGIEYVNRDQVGKTFESDSVTVKLTGKVENMFELVNFTSTLRVHKTQLNETELTCTGLLIHGDGSVKSTLNDSINICITSNELF